MANAAIAGNVHQFQKELVAARPAAAMKPALVPLGDSNQQALFVAQRILELREEGIDLNEIAVLYRAHYHSMEVQMELTRHGMPFSITSGLRFFEQAHVKDVAAFLKFASIRATKSPSSAWRACCPASARARRSSSGARRERGAVARR